MRIFAFILLAVLLNAAEVVITGVSGNSISVDKYVKKGVSGVVVCPYGESEIICAEAVFFGKKARLYPYAELKNDAFALPLVYPKKGDRVILAKDYGRILIIAPNQQSYIKVKSLYPKADVISPDVFASTIDELPKKSDFVSFAKKMDIGRYVFVLDRIYEVDAKSFYVLKSYSKNTDSYTDAFFTTFGLNFKHIDKSYYKSMLKD